MQIEIPNDGGVTSLPADLASQIDTALASAPPAVQRITSQMGTTQAEIIYLDEYLKDNGVSSGVPQEVQPATPGQNIAASAIQLGQSGFVEPAIGGFANAWFMGKVGPIINDFGARINNSQQMAHDMLDLWAQGKINQAQYEEFINGNNDEREQYYKSINSGSGINTPSSVLNQIATGGSLAYGKAGNYEYYCIYGDGLIAIGQPYNGHHDYNIYNYTSNAKTYTRLNYNKGKPNGSLTVNVNQILSQTILFRIVLLILLLHLVILHLMIMNR